MSIYSGFATRFQQESYDHCIDSLLYILQKRIIKFYQNEQADQQKFITLVLKLCGQMKNMQKSKYLEPKSSQAINQLVHYMQVFQQNINNPQGQDVRQQLPNISSKTLQHQLEKKKNIYWVEKQSAGENDKKYSEEQVQTLKGQMDQSNHNSKKAIMGEYRKTSYMSSAIRGVKHKQTSPHPYQSQRQDALPPSAPKRRQRVMSNYLYQQPENGQSRASNHNKFNYGDVSSNATRKRRIKSGVKRNTQFVQSGSRDRGQDVSDIIKQYIVKSKKNFNRGFRKGQQGQSWTKLNDF